MGGAAKTVKRGVLAGATGGLSEFVRQDPFGSQIGNLNPVANIAKGILPSWATGYGGVSGSGSGSDPFHIDPAQIAADQAAINALGTQQRGSTDAFNKEDQDNRASARDALASALTKQSQAYFNQGLPATEETLNAQHLLNGSGLGQEIGRQQGNLATNIANQVGVQGANDMSRASDISLMGLQQQQQQQQAALSRGFALNDFINQANIQKSIGAASTPQVGNGKGQTGTLLNGIGSLAPLAGAVMGGPSGKAAGSAVAGAAGGGGLGSPLSLFNNNTSGLARYS